MKNKVTICSACGCPVAKAAKVCPHCGVTRRRPLGVLAWVGVIAGFLAVIYMLATPYLRNAATPTPSVLDPAANVQVMEESQAEKLFPQTNDCGKWNITVTGTSYTKDELLDTSGDNSKLLAVSTTVINNGNATDYFVYPIPVKGAITCSIRYKGYKYDHTWLSSIENAINGQQLNPLEKASGVLLFSLPETVIKDVEEPLYLVFVEGEKTAEFRVR